MTTPLTDYDLVANALKRLNPEFHKSDSSWGALQRLKEQADKHFTLSNHHGRVDEGQCGCCKAEALLSSYRSRAADLRERLARSDCIVCAEAAALLTGSRPRLEGGQAGLHND